MAAADPRDSPSTDRNPGLKDVTASGPRDVSRDTATRSTTPQVLPAKGARSAESDTLLSAPAPATREDLALDQRLSQSEQQISELLLRVERLERTAIGPTPRATRAPWFWLVFLAGLALAWQILSRFQ